MADESFSPFAPPKANLEGVVVGPGDVVMADRGTRLAAVLLDSLIFLPLAIPFGVGAALASKGPDGPGALFFILMGIGGLLALGLVIFQIYLLATRGQTLGKRWMKVRIVKLDGSNPGFVGAVLLRVVVGAVIGIIPYVGGIYGLVDILFIFRDDRRCIHDLIAGTRVIVAV